MEVFTVKEIWNWIQLAFAAVGAFLGWFLGGFDGFLYTLVTFVAIDYLTGVLCAITDKSCPAKLVLREFSKRCSSL